MLCRLAAVLLGLFIDELVVMLVLAKYGSGEEVCDANVGTDDRESLRVEPWRRGGGGAGFVEVCGAGSAWGCSSCFVVGVVC